MRVRTRGDDIANLPSQLDMAIHTATLHVDQIIDIYGIAESALRLPDGIATLSECGCLWACGGVSIAMSKLAHWQRP